MFHLIGIGGLGMSALARVLADWGYDVSGSDARSVELDGIKTYSGHAKEHLDLDRIAVYSTAIDENNPERKSALELWHRSDLLQYVCAKRKSLVVTGTHGKTTTSTLLAHTLMHAGKDSSYVLGGYSPSLESNGRGGNGEHIVIEGDESDGSFLKCNPFGAIVTNLEIDHLDYWGSKSALEEAFKTFCEGVQGPLIWCSDDENLQSLGISGIEYSLADPVDFHLPLLGEHNRQNALGVYKLCMELGLTHKQVQAAFNDFQGIKRRMEFRGVKCGIEFFDDYAHHPTEIEATMQASEGLVGAKNMHVVFQPHRFTRTRDLWSHFLQSFAHIDHLILTDVFTAGESDDEFSLMQFVDAVPREKNQTLLYVPRDELASHVQRKIPKGDALMTMGAGDITRLYEEI